LSSPAVFATQVFSPFPGRSGLLPHLLEAVQRIANKGPFGRLAGKRVSALLPASPSHAFDTYVVLGCGQAQI